MHPDNIPLAAEACYYFIRIGSSKALEEVREGVDIWTSGHLCG